MGWLITGILFTIIAFVALGLYEDQLGSIRFAFRPRQALSALCLLLCLAGCIKTVPTGHTGVVTSFGRVEDYTLEAGVHFQKPWAKVVKMDNRTQKASLNLSCFSSDIQEVSVIYTVNYQINKTNASAIYRNIGTEYFSIVVEPRVYEAIKGTFAKYNAEALLSNRDGLSKEIQAILLNDVAAYNIEIVSTSIEDIDFNDAFTTAVEQKQVAEQNKLKAQTEQEQKIIEAEAAATRSVLEAEAKAEQTIIAAQAKADADLIAAESDATIAQIAADSAEYQGQKDAAIMSAIGAMLKQYPELVQYYYTMNWDGKLPETMLGSDTTTVYPIQ